MSRFRTLSPQRSSEGEDRPSMIEVFDHYGVPVVDGKDRQMVRCPLHEDRTPSCSVNLELDVWRCHSCSQGGDVFSLIMMKEEVDFVGARTFAAQFGGATGGAGGRGAQLREGRFSRGGPVSDGARDRSGHGGYVPRWRR